MTSKLTGHWREDSFYFGKRSAGCSAYLVHKRAENAMQNWSCREGLGRSLTVFCVMVINSQQYEEEELVEVGIWAGLTPSGGTEVTVTQR